MTVKRVIVEVEFCVGDKVRILGSDNVGTIWAYQIVGRQLFVTYLVRYMVVDGIHELWLCDTDLELVEAVNAIQEDNER